ncbi:hypothetical protein PIB30_046730 [Stylosanthes scabra]|uniref:Uncharacterized protein n=1 Tax=Stylosanthes scabra TaxID=79078 RepID=A0ABU6QH94_9FABA|nr:hypothetical protein [Stylosanthes scabra]
MPATILGTRHSSMVTPIQEPEENYGEIYQAKEVQLQGHHYSLRISMTLIVSQDEKDGNPRNGFVTRERLDRALAIGNGKSMGNRTVREGWNQASIHQGNAWQIITGKIQACKATLTKWSRKTFKRADKEIEKLKHTLKDLQDKCPIEEIQQQVQDVKLQISSLWR